MQALNRGAVRRLVAVGASAAMAVAGLTLGLAAPAHAAPVTVSGTLTDATGNALDGYVVAYALAGESYTYATQQYVADGVIALPVEPGTYKFRFSEESDNYVDEWYNDKPTEETADPVVVTGSLALAPVALAARPAIIGQVVSPSGRAIEDAYVSLLNSDTDTTVTSSRTKADGTFRVGANAGTYKLRVSASGFTPEYFDNSPTLAAASPIALGATDVGLPQIVMQDGTTVTGRVTNLGGAGLERVSVSLQGTGSTSNYYYGDTDAAGNLLLEGVAPGTYKVRFSDTLDEYLEEWWNDKPTQAAADVLTVGLDPVVGLDAQLAPDPANVAPDPATVDLAGTVTDSKGAVVVGAKVQVWDTPNDGDKRKVVSSEKTNRAGQYFVTNIDGGFTSEDSFKVLASDGFSVAEGAYRRLDRWFGGAQTYGGAPTVGVPTGAVNISLPLTGGISGTITSVANLPVSSAVVSFFDPVGNPTQQSGSENAKENGTYATTSLVPGKYKVLFSDYAYAVDARHAPEWYDNTTFSKAKVITVKSGETVTGINAALGKDLLAVRKPEINGKPYLKGKLRAYPGVWSLESGTSYQYEWLIGSDVVATGPTYKVPASAKNKRITLRVLAENSDLSGIALVSTQVIKKKPKVKIKVSGKKALITVSGKKIKAKKIKGKVIVQRIVRTDEYGTPVYKKVAKGKLKNGKARLTLKKLKKGKNKLVFSIKLKGGKLGDATVNKTVKVKR